MGFIKKTHIVISKEIQDIVPAYVASLKTDLDRLKTLTTHGDLTEVVEFAHRLKGVAESYGFPMLTQWGKDLEVCAQSGKVRSSGEILESISSFIDGVEIKYE